MVRFGLKVGLDELCGMILNLDTICGFVINLGFRIGIVFDGWGSFEFFFLIRWLHFFYFRICLDWSSDVIGWFFFFCWLNFSLTMISFQIYLDCSFVSVCYWMTCILFFSCFAIVVLDSFENFGFIWICESVLENFRFSILS